MPAADWIVTFAVYNASCAAPPGLDPAAYFGMPLDQWDGVTPTYKAILSTLTEYARDRVPITGRVYNTHGELVATSLDQFWSSYHTADVGYDEYGNALPGSTVNVWTGTSPTGGYRDPSCNEWTSSSGGVLGTVGNAKSRQQWLTTNAIRADLTARLYGVSPPITYVPEPSTLALLGIAAAALLLRRTTRQ
jgi:hypothetical protein